MKADPCFRCVLPDCDERSPHCLQRRLANSLDAKRRNGRGVEITTEERQAYNNHFAVWKLEDLARRSEGGRA